MTEIAVNAEGPRLAAIEQYGLAELPHDPALDDIARLAAELCGAPLAGIGIVEQEGTTFLGRHGFDLNKVPSGYLPCETTIEAEGIYQIPDARRDPAYAPGGIVFGDTRYRFYAGAPVLTPAGVAIGSLFVLDAPARKLTPSQLDSLEALSHMVTTRLELVMRVREAQRASRARQRVEAALTVEKNFVAAVLDTVGALVIVFDTAGRIVRFNRACEIISGYRSAELVGKFAWERLIPQEDVQDYIEGFERIRQGNFPTAFENHWLSRDGARRRISWSATALLDSQNQVAFLIATGIDVTVQRAAETKIRESEARYRQIIEGSLGLVCTHDLDGRILSINQHGAQSFGRKVEDVVGRYLSQFLYPERQHLLAPYFEALLFKGEAQGLMHLEHSNGEERVLAYRNRLVEPADGPRYVLAFAVDITEQVRAQDQLRALSRQSNSVLESVGDGIYGIDLDGLVTVVNPAAAQILGYSPEEMLGRNMHDLIHHSRPDGSPYPENECPIRASLQDLATIRVANEVFWRKDGRPIPVEYVARPQIETLEPEGGHTEDQRRPRAVGVVVAFTDISERNALDRMKDEFISTVSHELRTPLTSLRAALGLVASGALEERPEKAQQMMEIAISSTDRLVHLVNDILDLERIGSGKAEMHFLSCSIEEIFRRGINLLQAQAVKANVQFTIDAGGVTVWADPDRVLQTITNLLSNAIKFSPAAGTEPSEIRLTASYIGSDQALIEVEDHGRGIPAEKLEVIFERFQQVDASDSRAMGGTGLGLAICRAIVTQHGGQIWATSELGEGSTFHFTLPTQPRRRLR
jgi:two-component system, OmpR family, sensor histidine kinase VicK